MAARAVSATVRVRREESAKKRGAVRTRPSFATWAQWVPEPKTGALDFDRFPFQRFFYSDLAAEARYAVWRKATQAGVSALQVRWTLYMADEYGRTALYVFPKDAQLKDFSDTRVTPLLEGSEYLKTRVSSKSVRNKMLKQIGAGFVYYRGSQSKDNVQSVDADVIAVDEFDRCDQPNLEDADRRISGSMYGQRRKVSTPTDPEWGIDAEYLASDRRVWMVRCEACNRWQTPTWPDNIDMDRAILVCEECRRFLDPSEGEWVAEFPGRSVLGFYVPRFLVPEIARNEAGRMAEIIANSRKSSEIARQAFFNMDLGLGYTQRGGRLTNEVLQAAQRDYWQSEITGYHGANLVTMGVDVASVRALNVKISEHVGDGVKRTLFLGTADSFDEVATLMRVYNVHMAGVDHEPEGRLARGLAQQFPGRVYLVNFAKPAQHEVLLRVPDERRASVRRIEALDAVMSVMREQRNLLPQDVPDDYFAHMKNMVRRTEEDADGRRVVVFKKLGAEDYFQAEVYDLVASELAAIEQVAERLREPTFFRLEDRLEFQRSHLGESEPREDQPFSLGPEDGYSAGPGLD